MVWVTFLKGKFQGDRSNRDGGTELQLIEERKTDTGRARQQGLELGMPGIKVYTTKSHGIGMLYGLCQYMTLSPISTAPVSSQQLVNMTEVTREGGQCLGERWEK